MFKLVLVSKNTDSFSDFMVALKENGSNEVLYSESGKEALKILKQKFFDLLITDEDVGDMSGLELARKLISSSPMTNCAVMSSLPEKEFHEASEGLGLMNHLPLNPERSDAENVLKNLRRIKGLESGQE